MNLPQPPLASLVLAGLLTGPPGVLAAPPYEADWASLDQRPLPGWFNEAKVGIFICWGPYSVPAWAPKGKYAEWYGKRAQENTPWKSYHEKNYGKEFKYEQFAPMMTGAQFDPDEWAELIANSGAKYTAFAVNYHDGFAMWPTKFAMTPNTREWNAAVTGPKRNVTGELKTAFEKQDVKFGIYYSVYEWWHPLMKNKEEYALQWFHPKFKEVVSTYQPWFIFLDGEWSADHETWHSEELAAWLYNDSPVRDTVVTNDRWGKTRGKHGDIFSSEYGGGKGFGGHPWQEDRGIGSSYPHRPDRPSTEFPVPELWSVRRMTGRSRWSSTRAGRRGFFPSAQWMITLVRSPESCETEASNMRFVWPFATRTATCNCSSFITPPVADCLSIT